MLDEEKLVKNKLNLIYVVLKRYYPDLYFDEDYFQIGSIGLLEAIRTYDESKNYEFSTYAVKCIYNKIGQELRKKKAMFRIPEGYISSINRPISDTDDLTYEDLLVGSDDIEAEHLYFKEFLEMGLLSERDESIFLYTLNGYAQIEITKILGISQAAVSKRLKHIKTTFTNYIYGLI